MCSHIRDTGQFDHRESWSHNPSWIAIAARRLSGLRTKPTFVISVITPVRMISLMRFREVISLSDHPPIVDVGELGEVS